MISVWQESEFSLVVNLRNKKIMLKSFLIFNFNYWYLFTIFPRYNDNPDNEEAEKME